MTSHELQERRKEKHLTQEQLAERLGVHWSTVARWEQGVRSISKPMAKLIEIALGAGLKIPRTSR